MIICKRLDLRDDRLQEAGSSGWSFARGLILRMTICKRLDPPDDQLQEAGSSGWSVARGRIHRIIICKRLVHPDDYLQEAFFPNERKSRRCNKGDSSSLGGWRRPRKRQQRVSSHPLSHEHKTTMISSASTGSTRVTSTQTQYLQELEVLESQVHKHSTCKHWKYSSMNVRWSLIDFLGGLHTDTVRPLTSTQESLSIFLKMKALMKEKHYKLSARSWLQIEQHAGCTLSDTDSISKTEKITI